VKGLEVMKLFGEFSIVSSIIILKSAPETFTQYLGSADQQWILLIFKQKKQNTHFISVTSFRLSLKGLHFHIFTYKCTI
jgi:hypothetical protein